MNFKFSNTTISMVSIIFILLSFLACKQKPAEEGTITKGKATTAAPAEQSRAVRETPKKVLDKARVVFYNVENLFDIYDDPNSSDDEFTPKSEKMWTQDRYDKKLKNLSKVLKATGNGAVPEIMGLCEVENDAVIKDLITTLAGKGSNYKFVHKDSPDRRGIDAALLYDADKFELFEKDFIRIKMPAPFTDVTTRDIVYAGLQAGDEKIHLLVNHWSSRHGGEKETRPKRAACAAAARQKVESILKKDPKAKILLMGDFNDEPKDASLQLVLKAGPLKGRMQEGQLYNLSAAMMEDPDVGTYNYRGKWNVLDQMIVSSSLLTDRTGLHSSNSTRVFRKEWNTYVDKRDGPKPSKTYGGPNYYGGYSDHYPVYLDLQW